MFHYVDVIFKNNTNVGVLFRTRFIEIEKSIMMLAFSDYIIGHKAYFVDSSKSVR